MTEHDCVENVSEYHISHLPLTIKCKNCNKEYIYPIEPNKEIACPFCGSKIKTYVYIVIRTCMASEI